MTNVELAQQLHLSRLDMPIILAAGYIEMPDGASDCVTANLDKPFSDAALRKILAQVLS